MTVEHCLVYPLYKCLWVAHEVPPNPRHQAVSQAEGERCVLKTRGKHDWGRKGKTHLFESFEGSRNSEEYIHRNQSRKVMKHWGVRGCDISKYFVLFSFSLLIVFRRAMSSEEEQSLLQGLVGLMKLLNYSFDGIRSIQRIPTGSPYTHTLNFRKE